MEFPILFYTGVIKGWKKKTLLFVDQGFKLIDKNTNLKANNTIYPCRGAIVKESIKNNNTLEITLRNRRIFIQAFSPKEKQVIKDKIRSHINNINEKDSFTQEFNDYCDEINRLDEDNPSDSIFKNVETSISFLINYFLELNQKLDDFKTLIDTSKIGKNNRDNFNDVYNRMSIIGQKMKSNFDELVKYLYDYHDVNEKILANSEVTNSNNYMTFSINENESIKKNEKLSTSDTSEEVNEPLNTFEKDIYYDFEPRNKINKKIELNKNMIQEVMKAFSSGQKTLPIIVNEPISILQRECERFFFCDFLEKAAEESSIEMKFAYISAFITAEMSFYLGRILKPMVPLVGETYEYIDNKLKYKFFAEEVQRMPSHISAFIAEGEKWKYYGDNRNTSSFKFFLGSFSIEYGNKVHIDLLKPNNKNKLEYNKFIFNRPSTMLKGILINKLHYDFIGTVTIKCTDFPDVICTIEYLQGSNEIEEGSIKGQITKGEEILYLIGGNWKTELFITDKNSENKKVLYSVKDEEFTKNSVDNYVLPEYSCNLNYINDKLKEILPISDSRFRPDQKEFEEGSTEKAQSIKNIIEEIQIQKQEKNDNNNIEYNPIYFSNEYNEDSGDFVFLYKGGYWEDRKNKNFANKIVDIFDTSCYIPPEPQNLTRSTNEQPKV